MIFYNFFKDKKKKREEFSYLMYIVNVIVSMFEYKNLPFSKEYLEQTLLYEGAVGIGKEGNEIFCGSVSESFDIGTYGEGTRGSVLSIGQKRAEGVFGVDIVRGYNNYTHTYEDYITWLAHMLANIDHSLECNVNYSKYNPFIMVEDENVKNALEQAIENFKDGKMWTFLKTRKANALGSKGFEIGNLTDVRNVDKIQYISKLHDDIMRRFANRYGQNLSPNSKMAQMNDKELEGYDTFSLIYPLAMLDMRKQMVADMNRIFGTTVEVDFSMSWKIAIDRLMLEREVKENADIEKDMGTENRTDTE